MMKDLRSNLLILALLVVACATPAWFAGPDEGAYLTILGAGLCIVHWLTSKSSAEEIQPASKFSLRESVPWMLAMPGLFGGVFWFLRFLVEKHAPSFTDYTFAAFALAGDYALVFHLARRMPVRQTSASWVLAGGTLACAIVSVSALQDWAIRTIGAGIAWREFGPTSNPDFFAAYLVIWFPAALAFYKMSNLYVNRGKYGKVVRIVAMLPVLLIALATLSTGSRFATLSLAAGAITTLLLTKRDTRSRLTDTSSRRLSLTITLVVIGVLAIFLGRPLLSRVIHPEGNSFAFRIWTWRGTAHMVAAHPIAGSGFGAYAFTYPQYAITGFTRHAHDSYLQIAAECGIPAAVLFIVGIVLTILIAARSARSAAEPSSSEHGYLVPERYFHAALAGAAVAGAFQCLIDSDFQQPFFGICYFLLAGFVFARPLKTTEPARTAVFNRGLHAGIPNPFVAAGLFCFTCLAVSSIQYSAFNRLESKTTPEQKIPPASLTKLATAVKWAPWNGNYLSDFAIYDVWAAKNDIDRSIDTQYHAVNLDPVPKLFSRLSNLYVNVGDKRDAAASLREGIKHDPNSFSLRWDLLSVVPSDETIAICKELVAIQQSPVVTVPALEGVTEVRYATVDTAVAKAALSQSDFQTAEKCSGLAMKVVEAYVAQNASKNYLLLAIPGAAHGLQGDTQALADYHGAADVQKDLHPREAAAIDARVQSTMSRYAEAMKPDAPR